MMRQYTTLFDRKYLEKGLCLYESLKRHSSEPFRLNVLCMDRVTAEILDALALDSMQLFPLPAFEAEMQLAIVRASRDWREYCWTLASVFTDYVLTHSEGDVTYLDADLYFFSDPARVFREIGDRAIAVTLHRLIPEKRYLEVNGKFNVGWVTFQGPIGAECVRRWAQQCRARCSIAIGCGDQKYLDEWPERYGADCHVIADIGVNVAPWNVGQWAVTEGPKVDGVPVVCYHAHEYQHGERFTNYDLRDEDILWIYDPYVRAYEVAEAKIRSVELLHDLTQSVLKMESERA